MDAVKQTMQTRWPVYMASMLLANGFGAILAYAFIRYGLPIRTTDPTPEYLRQNFMLFSLTLAIGGLISLGASAVMLRPVVRWQLRGGAPTKTEQMAALHAPLRQSIVHLFLWMIGGAIIAIQIIAVAPELAAAVVITVAMAATIVFGFSYMLGERILRPVAADALASGDFDRTLTPGVGIRMMLTWGLGTLAPSIGIVLLCVTQLTTELEVLRRLARPGDPAAVRAGGDAGARTVDAHRRIDLRPGRSNSRAPSQRFSPESRTCRSRCSTAARSAACRSASTG